MSTYLVTGAGRGFGLALTTQLAQRPEVLKVIVTTRSEPPSELEKVVSTSNGKVVHALCDVSKQESVDAAVAPIVDILGGRALDVLINNVGMLSPVQGGIANMSSDSLNEVFNTNVVSSHRMTVAMLPMLRKGQVKKVVNISTTVGSVNLARSFHDSPQPQYKITKAALNMLTVQYALDYEKEGFTFVALSPGWLRTELGGVDFADLPVDVGAKHSIDQIVAAGPEKNGHFLNIHVPGWEQKDALHRYDGKSPPW